MAKDPRRVPLRIVSDHTRVAPDHRPALPASAGAAMVAPAREPILERTAYSPSGQAAALAKADGSSRARMVTELQRSHGNVYVQRIISEARQLTKPAPSVSRVQRCGGKPCNCTAEEERAHQAHGSGAALQRLARIDIGGTIQVDHAGQQRRPGRARTAAAAIQRTVGDGHDLTSPRFAGDAILEACFDNEQLLKKGADGPSVQKVQEVLVELGHALPQFGADGKFGSETKKAVQEFQLESGLAFNQADGIIGPVTMELLDTKAPGGGGPGPKPKPLGSGSCDVSPCPAGTAQGAGHCCLRGSTPPPIMYDTCAVQIAPLAPGKKTADVQAEIEAGKGATPSELTTSTVSGVTTGTREEAFVVDVLRQLATRDRWCTEIDVIAAIGDPDTTGKVPSGQVTVRIDGGGNAAAELMNRGQVQENTVSDFFETTDPAFLKFIEHLKKLAIDRLKATFKFKSVTEENGRTWKIGELHKVEEGLARLKPDDISALDGLDLIRTDRITDPDDSAKELAGLFSHQETAAAGGAPASRSASIKLADLAFEGDKFSFVGDKAGAAPGSFQTILHEVGHAVETKAQRDATFADLEATAALNVADTAVNTAVTNFNSAAATARTAVAGYTRPQRTAMRAYQGAFNAAIGALNQFGQATAPQSAARKTAADGAIANRDARRAALQTASPTHPALTDFVQAETRQNEWLAAANNRVAPRAAFEQARAARAGTEVVLPGGSRRSRRLQNFVTFVTRNRIDPLTQYARENWPNEPGEFYAEAFGLWLNDPTYLKTNATLLFDWFEEGKHRE